jgi:lysozyme family protein
LEAFAKYNTIDVFRHSLYSTARVSNSTHPEGVRVALGIFGFVISTVHYNDLVLDFGPVRGNYDDRLIKTTIVPDDYMGDTTNINTYHYEGNQDN